MVTVYDVIPDSHADRGGVRKGDILLSVNGNEIRDVLDYRYYITEPRLSLLLHRGPDLLTVPIEKEEYEDIGLEFETYLMDKKATCRNKCIFCFIDQNPHGMRDTVYFKDDDSRLSFLLGNYVTLTNLTNEDIDRIIRMRLSPINISVHTTEPELRCHMMHNKHAGEVLSYLKRLAEANIAINAQIVLCKGVNDGAHLLRTLNDLVGYLPALQSVAVVPAGITAHREGLYPLSPFTEEEAGEVLDQINTFGDLMLKTHGSRLVYPSDEFYLTAKRPLPDEDYYEGYPQLENGVGMITSMRTEFEDALPYIEEDYDLTQRIECSIATGKAAYPFIRSLCEAIAKKHPSFICHVYEIENDFYGHTVTVAGLITARDLINQLKDKELHGLLLIPEVMLMNGEDVFLDNLTVEAVEKALSVNIDTVSSDGADLVNKITG